MWLSSFISDTNFHFRLNAQKMMQMSGGGSKPTTHTETTVEEVFRNLEISEFATLFTSEGIDLEAFLTCTEDDLKEANVPEEPRKKLLQYLQERRQQGQQLNGGGGQTLTGLQQFNRDAVTSGGRLL